MSKKIITLSIVGVAVFLITMIFSATTVFATKNFNSAKSNTSPVAPADTSELVPSAVSLDAELKRDSVEDASVDGPVESTTKESNLGGKAISVQAVEVRGWDTKQKKEFLTTVKTHAEVKSEQELGNFAKGVFLKDENVKAIATEEDVVQIDYNMPVKLFGIFNSSLKVHVNTDAKGQTKVKYPWYKFLFKKLVSASELKDSVEAALPEVDDEVSLGFEQQANIIQTISNILKTSHDSAMNSVRNMK